LEHFQVQFSRFPRHQGVTHWEGEISEGDMVPTCQVSRCPPLRYGAAWVVRSRDVRSRDFSAPPPKLGRLAAWHLLGGRLVWSPGGPPRQMLK